MADAIALPCKETTHVEERTATGIRLVMTKAQ